MSMTSGTYQADPAMSASSTSGPSGKTTTGRPRTATSTAEIDTTLHHPGSVRINVKGAFIVDQESATPRGGRGSPNRDSLGQLDSAQNNHSHETSDIRLPNHTAVVSHVAIDVCFCWHENSEERVC